MVLKHTHIWISKYGEKKIKKVKLDKLLTLVNDQSFTQKVFSNEKEAKEHKRNEHLLFR